jgi:hypothetical protein
VDLFALISSYRKLYFSYFFTKTAYINEEANGTYIALPFSKSSLQKVLWQYQEKFFYEDYETWLILQQQWPFV